MIKIKYNYCGVDGYLTRLDWDVMVGDIPYYAYSFNFDYKYLDSDSNIPYELIADYSKCFICRREYTQEKEILDNLVEAQRKDLGIKWKIEIEETSYIKNKWDELNLRTGCHLSIYRNNKLFYEDGCGTRERATRLAEQLIEDWENSPVDVGVIDFDKKLEGRKVYFRDDPAIVKNFMWGDGDVWLVPDKEAGCEKFHRPAHDKSNNGCYDYWPEYEYGLRVPLNSHDIWWFRD